MSFRCFLLLSVVVGTLVLSSLCAVEAKSSRSRWMTRPRFPSPHSPAHVGDSAPPPPFETLWYNQTLDHFSFSSKNTTYQQRYLVCDTYYQSGGPIFFYTGNEGDIVNFYNNTGFVTQVLGPQFNALIIFAEHRYYGESMPFGPVASFQPGNVQYLTSEQALADYAQLILAVKEEKDLTTTPVVAFGGSYGGMLSAWFRFKYPNIINGAIAASAPILQFAGTGKGQYAFSQIIQQDFTNASAVCAKYLTKQLLDLQDITPNATNLASLSKDFRLCTPLESPDDLADLNGWVTSAFTYAAMVDYPYPNSFLEPLPAWPVKAICDAYLNSSAGVDTWGALADGAGLFYNYTGQQPTCYNLSVGMSELGLDGWDYQSCTEMVMPIGSDGGFFPAYDFDEAANAQYCEEAWGVIPRPDWITTFYGGTNASVISSSNIVFSNGQLDPWRGGGVTSNSTANPDIATVIIEKGAHHLDLRTPNPLDPPSVIEAREIHIEHIKKWIA
eukprot:TRINITY_DN17070_c0_g1_i1.p1 TRINITY_DN17070_c0_g1~~TRINITY_DN17070_c0_g1_i1.p1  ORF type:complete len:512 (+),score=105.80 TRINITY_DN17070_c0_g1_i1:41-1537(+)